MARIYGTKWAPLAAINHGNRHAKVEFVVVHDTEAASLNGVESYFRGGATPDHVGAHFGIAGARFKAVPRQWADTNTLVYHAVGGNQAGIGIELCAFASYSRGQWILRRGQRIALAELIARICHEHSLGEPKHGTNVMGHGDITRKFKVPGGHTDPGANFPWDLVMALAVKRYRKFYPHG